MDVDWSELPLDLVENIANRLTVLVDYVRLRAVCGKWRSTLSPMPRHLPCQFPWLMLRSEPELPNVERHGFLDLLENKVYRLNMPIDRPWSRCCGSSHGWLVLQEERGPGIFLFNPLTSVQIELPPITTLPKVLDFDINKVGKEYLLAGWNRRLSLDEVHEWFFKKVILSTSPTSLSEDFVALAIVGMSMELAFYKKGDEGWTIIKNSMFFCDVIYYEGVFYAARLNRCFAIFDVSGLSPSLEVINLPSPVRFRDCGNDNTLYLVNAFGVLFMVYRLFDCVRVIDKSYMVYDTTGFEVVRLNSMRTKWVKVKSLGDHILFLGRSSSMCLSASEFSGCDGNHIYFTGESNKPSNHSLCNHDSGVFNLGNGSIEGFPSCTGNENSFLPPPVWFTPNPC